MPHSRLAIYILNVWVLVICVHVRYLANIPQI